jgi:cellulose synthase/poly-beta-1,6-N-acetylglucosamine synthase-like glycosyltransferase
MSLILQIIFWVAVLLMFHSYVLFPLLLKLLAAGKPDNDLVYTRAEKLPDVYILMAVYNEERVIRQKIESVLNSNYPLDLIQFHIGSDNSTDATNAIVQEYAAKYPLIKFSPFLQRNGKSAILNKLQARMYDYEVDEEAVLILTDANVFFSPDCIYEMVKHFKNRKIGQVASNVMNNGERVDGISHQEKGYIQRENLIKYYEGKIWGAMQGAFGACYAMRADCLPLIPKNYLMEDFYISMHILQRGKKAICELKAICYEDVSNEIREEFKRKTRISTGNYQNLSVYWPLLLKFDGIAFAFFSHKVIRWMGPFLILSMLLSSAILAVYSPFYLLVLMLLLLFLVSPLIDKALKSIGFNIRLLRFVAYFNVMNWALLYGFYKYVQGVQTSAWSPTKRNV